MSNPADTPKAPSTTAALSGYFSAAGGVIVATGIFWLARHYVDKGQASLLYLPVAIACAVRFGFGPAVLGAVLSFICWDYFFLPPFYTLTVDDPKDWLSLIIFLTAAVTTARLAAQARQNTRKAIAREAEIATLFEASEEISSELSAEHLIQALSRQLERLCKARYVIIFRRIGEDCDHLDIIGGHETVDSLPAAIATRMRETAHAACQEGRVIGFGEHQHLWLKALSARAAANGPLGAYVPLQAGGATVGVLHVAARSDGQPFSHIDERLILTLGNHAATVIARDALAAQAAQASALQEADVLKNTLLSLVSHELRSPLAAIKAAASGLLQEGSEWNEEDRTHVLESINRESDRLAELVRNLLDLSRIQAGIWHPSTEWCDLGEILGTVLDRLPQGDADRVRLEIADDLPLVQVDYIQVAQVLDNLIKNSIKYAPTGTPIVVSAIAAGHSDCSEDAVQVRVRDYGPGIKSGEEQKLFERFYRSKQPETAAVHGTGLGLTLARAIVEAHGGRIWAVNAPAESGPGAVFAFTLPGAKEG